MSRNFDNLLRLVHNTDINQQSIDDQIHFLLKSDFSYFSDRRVYNTDMHIK